MSDLDGIQKPKILKPRKRAKVRAEAVRPTVFVDAIVKFSKERKDSKIVGPQVRHQVSGRRISPWFFSGVLHRKFSLVVIVGVLVFGFAGGGWLVWRTNQTEAVKEGVVVQSYEPVPLVAGATTLGPINNVPNEVLFNLTIEQLESYLSEALKTDEVREAERLALRKQKLKTYLEEKRSPFVNIVDTIAELKHWKMVLAISNSESTLGKRCYSNNCSGIGVEPGHPLWRTYTSTAEWAKDLDRLIEKRYKDWTLEKMNGVYNQPGSQNWLLASKQVLAELQERGTE